MGRVAIALVVGWLLGVASGLAGVAVTDRWYEYRLLYDGRDESGARVDEVINTEGWQIDRVVQGPTRVDYYLRRPHIRFGR
jgi:hypothetical protein